MANINTVRKITIVAATEGVMYSKEQLDALKGSMVGVAKASEAMAAATVTETKTRLSAVTPLEKLERQFFQTVRAQQEFAKVTKVTNDALSQGTIAFEKINAVQLAGAQRFNQATQAGDKQNDAVVAWKQNLIRLREQYDPLFAAGNRYKESLAGINLAQQSGVLKGKQYTDAIQDTKVAFVQQVNTLRGVRDAHDEAAKATLQGANANRFAAHEIVNLSRQAQDVVVSLGSGQSFLTVLLQQGTQIVDVLANSTGSIGGLFSQVGAWANRVFTAGRIAAGGVVAIGSAILYAASSFDQGQREIDLALLGVGKRAGVTASDINKIASASASATGLSVDQARGAATAFAKIGTMGKENIASLTESVQGFAILIGKDVPEAVNVLAQGMGGDLVKFADELDSKFGFLSGSSRKLLIDLQNQNRIQEAAKIVIQGLAESTRKATETLGPFEKAWSFIGNTLSRVKNAVGGALLEDTGQEKLNELLKFQNELEASIAERRKRGASEFQLRGDIAALDAVRQSTVKTTEEMDKLAKSTASANFDKFSKDADNAVRSLIPQIEAVEKLEKALADLKRAQVESNDPMGKNIMGPLKADDPGSTRRSQGLGQNNEAATMAAELQLSLAKESLATADRHNQKVLEIANSYKGVTIQTALTLEKQKDQLTLANAVTGAQKLTAQELVRTKELIQQGTEASEAARISAGERAISQAQINSQAKEQLIALKNQQQVAAAVTGLDKMRAQYNATIKTLLDASVDPIIAQGIATQELVNTRAAADAAVEKQTRSLEQQVDLIKAQISGTEDKVRAEQAYQNAIDAGASVSKADAVADATERVGKAQKEVTAETQRLKAKDQERLAILKQQNEAASEYHKWVESIYDGTNRLINAMNFAGSSGRDSSSGSGGSGLGFEGTPTKAGGFDDATWKQLMQQGFGEGKRTISDFENVGYRGLIQIKPEVLAQEAKAALDKLINPLEMQRVEAQIAGDKPGEIKAVQSELDIYKQQPRTLENLNAIKSLTETLKSLNESTDTLTDSVDAMNITLDPIYSSGRDALKIGYYDQGGGSSKGYVTGSPTAVSQPQMPSPSIVPPPQPVGVTRQPGWPGPYIDNGWTPGITQPGQASFGGYTQAAPMTEQGRMAFEEWLKSHPQPRSGMVRAATGFSGIMGGSGGTDSQLFQAMVTPGEHVDITPPGQPRTPSWQDRQIRQTNDNAPRTTINNNNRYVSFNFNVGGGDRSDLSSRATRRQMRESYGRETAAVA